MIVDYIIIGQGISGTLLSFKMMQQNKSQSVEIFSTSESALEWLNSNFDKNEILDVLGELKLA